MIRLRTALAIAGGSAAASAITTLALAAWNIANSAALSADAPIAYVAFCGLLCAVTAVGAASIGLVWHSVSLRKRWTPVWVYVLPAMLIGGLVPIILAAPSGFSGGASLLAPLVGIGLGHGGLTALFAWLIRRPDRDRASDS